MLRAFKNQLTLDATRPLRFHFERNGGINGMIVDSTRPTLHWALKADAHGQLTDDYGIAARFIGQQSYQPTVIAAGLEQCGTEASMELLTDGAEQLAQSMPAGWKSKNFEVLVEVHVVNDSCGMPEILRVASW